VGVAMRVVAMTGRLKWTGPAATTLLVIGGVAAYVAAKSGTAAHGPVERIPGARQAVEEHEEWGERTRNVFVGVAALELIALALSGGAARTVRAVSALAGIAGVFVLYEAAEHGGELVYSYAGGPGLRTGNPADVQRLLLAGLYNQSREDRKAGHSTEAASLVDEMARRFPLEPEVRLLRVESLMLDRKDYAAARMAADSVPLLVSDARLRARQATLKADAYLGMSQPDSARAVLAAAVAAFPQNARLKAKLDSIK